MKVRKSTLFALSFAAIAAVCHSANAEESRPSRQTLRQMGLSGLVVMSDEEASTIRGQGYRGRSSAAVFGFSFASIETKNGMAGTEDAYAAEGKHFAAGGSHSKAKAVKTTVHISPHGFGLSIRTSSVSASGGAFAIGF